MTREEKIQFCIQSAEQFGEDDNFEDLTDEELDKRVEWFDYLWEK